METWEGECDFAYLQETYHFKDELEIDANVASDIKRKFRFPTQDPSENVIIDDRQDSQKVADILRIWSQVLKPEEAEIWSDIAERDVTKDISLRSGLRTPKAIIDREIKMFKDISSTNKNKMSSLLQKLPDIPCKESNIPLSTQDSSLTTPLSFSSNKLPNLSHLNTDTVANFGSLEPDDNQSEGQSECRTSPFEQVNLQELTDDCVKQVQFLRQQNKHPQRLHTILKSNSKLLLKFMILLKSKHKLRKNM